MVSPIFRFANYRETKLTTDRFIVNTPRIPAPATTACFRDQPIFDADPA